MGGGYTGQGVASANAAGVASPTSILERDTDLTRLPWVGHRSRRWEPEPLRWLGIHSFTAMGKITDALDAREADPHRKDQQRQQDRPGSEPIVEGVAGRERNIDDQHTAIVGRQPSGFTAVRVERRTDTG